MLSDLAQNQLWLLCMNTVIRTLDNEQLSACNFRRNELRIFC